MVGRTIGHYRLEAQLGAGGMGVVYRAHDTRLDRPVALKLLAERTAASPLARARFLREARAAARLDHPGIAAIHEVGEDSGNLFIAMALCPGETLRQRLERGPLTPSQCRALLAQILSAVAAAHQAGIVHRDLKPANVMVGPDGRVKVLDFGLAKLREDDGATDLTEGGTTLGTLAYMSPEQARGEAVDARSDLWSVGVMAHEMLAGKHPFAGSTPTATLARILSDQPAPLQALPGGTPAELAELVARLLVKDPGRRIASAAVALTLLEAPAASAPRAPRARSPLLAAAALATLAALAVTVGWLARRQPPAAPEAAAAGASGPAASVTSFVQLPCRVFAAAELAYLADAIPGTMAMLLAPVPGLNLRKPPNRVEVDPATADLRRLARLYQVGRCLTCTVTADRERLLLGLQLIDPASGQVKWSGSWEGSQQTYLALIHQAADELRRVVAPSAGPAPTLPTPASNELELSWRRGHYHSNQYNNRRDENDLRAATAAFARVLELDPNSAQAMAELARLEAWKPAVDVAAMERLAQRALALDPRCGSARALGFYARLLTGQVAMSRLVGEAIQSMADAPDDEIVWYMAGMTLGAASDALALAAMEQATRIDPLYAWGYIGQAQLLVNLGRLEQALDRLDRAIELEPGGDAARMHRCLVLAQLGRQDEAGAAWRALEADPEPPAPPHLFQLSRATFRWMAARPAEAAAARDRLAALVDRVCVEGVALDDCYQPMAPLFAAHGGGELFMRVIERTGGRYTVDFATLRGSPTFASLRSQPGFPALLATSRAVALETLPVIRQARQRGELPAALAAAATEFERALDAAP